LKFIPVPELDDLPGIEWLIEGIVPAHGIAVLYGEPGHGKSFVAIDWSLSVAAGLDWAGRKVLGGPVVYIVGEGSPGMKDRMKAWQLSHPAADISTAFVVLEPIMLHDRPAHQRFINGVAITFKQTPPSLIVLDTLAQNFVGGDENSAQDMGVWLHGARMLQEKFGSTVLIVHHAARGSGRERGSTALRGASDTMIHMRRPSERVNSYKMACTKQKEGECFADTLFEIVPVAGTSSAVLKLAVRNDAVAELAGAELEAEAKLTARVNTIAASTASLNDGANTLAGEFATLSLAAARSRLQRARGKAKVVPIGVTSIADVPDVSLYN
jgi:hypothetical protein